MKVKRSKFTRLTTRGRPFFIFLKRYLPLIKGRKFNFVKISTVNDSFNIEKLYAYIHQTICMKYKLLFI